MQKNIALNINSKKEKGGIGNIDKRQKIRPKNICTDLLPKNSNVCATKLPLQNILFFKTIFFIFSGVNKFIYSPRFYINFKINYIINIEFNIQNLN